MAIEVDFRVGGGELALVDARHSLRPAWLADLCCGLLPLSGGSVRFLGHDWSAMPQDYAAALRGRIGRVFQSGNWVDFIDVATNILLPQLHHTRDDPIDLRERAIALSCAFGLPGLPLVHPRRSRCERFGTGGLRSRLSRRSRVDSSREPGTRKVQQSYRAAARRAGGSARPRRRGDLVYPKRSSLARPVLPGHTSPSAW